MSVYVNNKNLQVTLKNNDYAKDTTLQTIIGKLTTSAANPLSVSVVNTDALAADTTLRLTNDKLDLLNASVASVVDSSGLNINHPATFGNLLDGMTLLAAGATSSAVEPVGTTNTIFGICVSASVTGVNLTVQFSNDGMVWYDSMNKISLAQNDPIELTFWSAAKFFRVSVDQECKVVAQFGSK